ncbi:MAG: DUF309 domain-containing protein [Conexivisphaerales archaeon]
MGVERIPDKRIRYLIRVRNIGLSPTAEDCLKVKERLKILDVDAFNIRISSQAIEFDIFGVKEDEIKEQIKKIGDLFTEIIDAKNLSTARDFTSFEETLKESSAMIEQERYWEAHELLESKWRSMPKGSEKELLQGFILLCAAHVHRQKGRRQVAVSILERALRKLELYEHDNYYGVDIRSLKESVAKQVKNGQLDPRISLTFRLNS